MAAIDVVVVSYNNARELRRCVEPLADASDLRVFVVDNASADGTVETVADLDVTVLRQSENRGFAAGCNAGWRAGAGTFVLFLNPDATLPADGVRRLAKVLERDDSVGLVGPRIVGPDGRPEESAFSFATPSWYWRRALFLHRLVPSADAGTSPDWVSGACMLLRRATLERLGGLDDGFFMYCEDMDLARRVRALGLDVRLEPEVEAVHVGGASAPGAALQHVLVRSRIRYARKHFSRAGYVVARSGIAASELTRLVVTRGGRDARAGHARALAAALGRSP